MDNILIGDVWLMVGQSDLRLPSHFNVEIRKFESSRRWP